jgi:hypothetical protein
MFTLLGILIRNKKVSLITVNILINFVDRSKKHHLNRVKETCDEFL